MQLELERTAGICEHILCDNAPNWSDSEMQQGHRRDHQGTLHPVYPYSSSETSTKPAPDCVTQLDCSTYEECQEMSILTMAAF